MPERTDRMPEAAPLVHEVPESLKPTLDGPRFADLTKETITSLAESGWERFGVVAIVINPQGEILTVTHGKGYSKVPEGTMGVLSETMHYTQRDGEVTVEQIDAALSRLFTEECGVSETEISQLNEKGSLQAAKHGAWEPVSFPLSNGRFILGLVVALRADEYAANILSRKNSGFVPTDAIKHATFVRPEPLAAENHPIASVFRVGTPDLIRAALEKMTSPEDFLPLMLPPPQTPPLNSVENLSELRRT